MHDRLYEELCGICGKDSVKTDEPMREHTSFRIGGNADFYVSAQKHEQVAAVIEAAKKENIPWFILGNGTNILVSDKGYRGVVITQEGEAAECVFDGIEVTSGAGVMLPALASMAAGKSLTGLEFASGIPGTVGGAVIMNAGAYGSEMKNVLKSVKALVPGEGIREIPASGLELGYRTSIFKRNDWVVLEAKLALAEGNKEEIIEKMNDLKRRRNEKQPLEFPSAGSTFKRPEGYFAGKLIMDAGFAGFRVGGACVSAKHCGFVINDQNASAEDVVKLINIVKEGVKERFGVTLEPEILFLGEF